jgi:methylmalonyl-CoA/ethylmalonyl-CoA epimerase
MTDTTPSDPSLRLHHVGIVVNDIDAKRRFYEESLGYKARTEVIHDPVQGALVQFLAHPNADHYLELVAPDGPASKLVRASRKGAPLHHLCYATPTIELTLKRFAAAGSLVFQEPAAAVAFGGRRVAWLINEDGLLIELVERGGPGDL